MNTAFFRKLNVEGIICDDSLKKVEAKQANRLFSVHWELKTLLYLGVILLTTGLGIIIYQNIDTIGHQAILGFIALLCAASFFYCVRIKKPFSIQKVEAPNPFFDYVLLLGCLSFITFIGYLQFQYDVFGNRFGLASFIPMLVLFFCAYYFDHLGILSLAITNLATWLGISVTPTRILRENDFNSESIIYTGLFLGVLLIVAAMASQKTKIKQHFEFTYSNFGTHILFISCLAAMFSFDRLYFLWFLLLMGICVFYYRKAILEKSFYYLLLLTVYGYIGLSYVVIRLLFYSNLGGDVDLLSAGFIYFIASAVGMILFLITMNKKIKAL